jgi:hypothetical protein
MLLKRAEEDMWNQVFILIRIGLYGYIMHLPTGPQISFYFQAESFAESTSSVLVVNG